MNILDKIIRHKIQEINSLKIKYAVSDLESRKNFYKETSSLKKVLLRQQVKKTFQFLKFKIQIMKLKMALF